jgi:hypothetical protein
VLPSLPLIRRVLNREHDHARAILARFLLSRFMFMVLQIGLAYDETRFRRRDRYAPALFRLEQPVEMRMPLVHA